MPQLFVVTDQKTVKAVANAVLTARTSATRRVAAMAAIRAANPTLDLDHLAPGTVVVIPEVPGQRKGGDAAGESPDELVGRALEGIAALAAGAEQGEAARLLEKKETQDLFQSAAVKRVSHAVPGLAKDMESIRALMKEDDSAAKRQQAELRDAADGWAADLAALRELWTPQ